MISLPELQRAFANALLSDDAGSVAAFIEAHGISAERRVQIYRNNARVGFATAMLASFPVLQQLGGDEWFQSIVRRYQQRSPSRCGDLQYVGERFAEFLHAEFSATEFAYFADIAVLEWAYQEVLVGAEQGPLVPADLAAVAADDYEQLRFSLHPAVRIVASAYPIFAIWQANQVDTVALAAAIDLGAGASHVLVARRAEHVELRELSPDTFALLLQLAQGSTLGEATEEASSHHDGFDVGSSLRQLFALGAFAAFSTTDVH